MEFKKIVQIILFCVIGVVFYYSWLPNPDFRNETYLPQWILNWSNYYYNLRTGIPFIGIGFLLEAYSRENRKIETVASIVNFITNMGIAAVVVCIAEGGQFLIARRNPDLKDVFFGILGSVVGGIGYHLVNKIMYCKKIRNAK